MNEVGTWNLELGTWRLEVSRVAADIPVVAEAKSGMPGCRTT
jgi:hypothetical protein